MNQGKIQEKNSIQSTLPKEKTTQTSKNNERNDAERIKMQSNHQKFSYSGNNYLGNIKISQRRTGQDYYAGFEKMNKKKTIFKGGFRNRKRKSRQYLYLYNDHHKRRSKVSKPQNLRASGTHIENKS